MEKFLHELTKNRPSSMTSEKILNEIISVPSVGGFDTSSHITSCMNKSFGAEKRQKTPD